MMSSTTKTTTTEVLAELDATLAAISAAQKSRDHAAAAAGYERKRAAWERLTNAGFGSDEDNPDVLRSLLAHASSANLLAAAEGARQYRRWAESAAAEREASGRSA